jgi:hypothetical protein
MLTAKIVKGVSSVLVVSALLLAAPPARAAMVDPSLTQDEISQIGQEAYVYGLQQVVFYETRFSVTQFEQSPLYSGVNNFKWLRRPITADFRFIVTPNATTLYGFGFHDLSKEPVVVELPAIDDLYFTYQLMDHYGDYFYYAGNQFTGRDAHKFIVVGPGWSGRLPEEFTSLQIVVAPSSSLFAIARLGLENYEQSTVDRIVAYQDQITTTPLSMWLENGKKGVPSDDNRTPIPGGYANYDAMGKFIRRIAESIGPMDYFRLLSMVVNDPTLAKRTDSIR